MLWSIPACVPHRCMTTLLLSLSPVLSSAALNRPPLAHAVVLADSADPQLARSCAGLSACTRGHAVRTACPRVIRNQRSHARHTVSHLLPAQKSCDDGAHSNICCGRAAALRRCVAQQRRSPRPRIVRPAPLAVYRSTADQQSPGGHEHAADCEDSHWQGQLPATQLVL